jgi:hypothetical protein
MKSRIAAIALCALGACMDSPSAPHVAGSVPAFAKATSATDSRAQWFFNRMLWDGVTATKLYGDGRLLDGSPVVNDIADPSGYDGESRCAVQATINWYKSSPPASGDVFFAPQGGSSPLCQGIRRTLTVDSGAGVLAVAWPTTVHQIMQIATGQSRTQDEMWGPVDGIANCARLRYSVPDLGSGVTVTRVSGNTSRVAGTWTVESRGTHMAGCYNFTKGSALTHTGPDFYLPFSVTIVEVLR